ncbi:MAG: lysophospholipid acyltransferase family protein [Bacteroidetes bacterium]|nr:lysophospholipid acyltransferase family protein [Bacteroidota bacterium]
MKRIASNIVAYLIKGFSKLPLRLLYVFGDLLYLLMFYIIRYRRKVVHHNLVMSFPEKSTQEIHNITRKFYRHFSDLMIESLKNAGDTGKKIPKRIHYKNADLLHKIYEQGKSIILYAGHYGNWEWLSVLPITFRFKMIAFYQPLSNSVIDDLIKKSRERYGIVAVPSASAYKALKTYNDEGIQTLSLVLGDQSPPANGNKVWLPFLNRETAFLVGAGKIAKKLDHSVVFPHFRKISRGNYEIEFILIQPEADSQSENPYIKGYARQLESSILSNPPLWLWSHRRWKLNREIDQPK